MGRISFIFRLLVVGFAVTSGSGCKSALEARREGWQEWEDERGYVAGDPAAPLKPVYKWTLPIDPSSLSGSFKVPKL
jgi:hypothetical protein